VKGNCSNPAFSVREIKKIAEEKKRLIGVFNYGEAGA